MTTSGVTPFSLTARDHITAALDENTILPLGDDPTAVELDKCLLRLNAMLKSWQQQGVIWKQETITVTTTPGSPVVALPEYVREVNGARYVDSPTNERQMSRWERDDYLVLPNKLSPGPATCFNVVRESDGVSLNIWPVPMSAATLKLDIDRKMDTVTDPTQTLDIPEELQETVYTALAVRCAGIFGKEPKAEMVARSNYLVQVMLDDYRPASYILEAG